MQRLIQTSEFYETIDLIITPIILADSQTVCHYVNKAFLSQIGYDIDVIQDQEAWFEVVYPDENYREEIKQNWRKIAQLARDKGETHAHMVTKICCADGSYKWFDLHENIYGDSKVVTFLDVDELQENYEELTDVLKQKDILMSIIAHDVRSPLGNIKHIIDNYKSLDLSELELKNMFSGVGDQIDYIFNIINALLIRTSADRGSFVEKRERINLQDFFSKYQSYYKDRIEKHNLKFVFELSGNVSVEYDPFILDVISRNLIDNAIKFSPDNGSIYISFEKKPGYAELTIKDNGPGMSTEQSDRILNNKGSRRLKNQITDSFGLGLVMAKEILERHHGELFIKSELGKGTSFVIRLLNDLEN